MLEEISRISDDIISFVWELQKKSPLDTEFDIYHTEKGWALLDRLLQWVTKESVVSDRFRLIEKSLEEKWYTAYMPSASYFLEKQKRSTVSFTIKG